MSPSPITHARIRTAAPGDATSIAALYNYYVTQTTASFEEDPVTASDMAQRITTVSSASLPWLVAETRNGLVGYAYAAKWKSRCSYRLTVEISGYVHPDYKSQGIGSKLYEVLFPSLTARGIHSVIAGISLPNEVSVALHEKFGLRKVAHFSQVGFKFDRWIDVGYWQRLM